MSIRDMAWCWNATDEERQATYPCDRHMGAEYRGMLRAIDIQAPVSVVFRGVCQLKVASYSYDWIDNMGGRSPRLLTPSADFLEPGQNFMIGRIVEFEVNYSNHWMH